MWMEDLQVDRTRISLLITMTLFTGNCIAPLMGYLIDRFPARLITHLPTYLTLELDFELLDASYVLAVAGGAAIAGKIIFGWLMDHWDAKATVLFGVARNLCPQSSS